MEELIKVNYGNERPTVLARDLYDVLNVQERFSRWFDRMCEYGFDEGVDFNPYQNVQVRIEGTREVRRDIQDYQMTIEMAKEIAMLQRNDKGKQVRQYFIELEKAWNTPEQVMARALRIADKKINELMLVNKQQSQQIAELQPKADYTDKILQSKDLLTVRQIAMDYGMTPNKMNRLLHELGVQYKQSGQWFLYSKYVSCGYTKSTTYVNECGNSNMYTKWTQKGRLFLYELLKSNGVLPLIEREDMINKQAA